MEFIVVIISYFSSAGSPALGLTPTIKIYEHTSLLDTLIVNGANCREAGDGMYIYNFAGVDTTKTYSTIVDAGVGMATSGRYSVGVISAVDINHTNVSDIATETWSALGSSYTATGTMGQMMNEIKANTYQTAVDQVLTHQLLDVLIKYERNRTKIDKIAHTLTVYNDDGITPLKVFDLVDSNGYPSVVEVCERLPR